MIKTARCIVANVAPLLPHDCPRCRFLGRLNGNDLYACGNELVVRFGWEEHEYRCWDSNVAAPEGSEFALAKKLQLRRLRPGRTTTNAYVA